MKRLAVLALALAFALSAFGQVPAPPNLYGNGMQVFDQGLSNWRIGFDIQAQSNRFIAETTSGVQSVRVFIKTGSGYSAGNGGVTTISIETDDGTVNHFPSGTVLVSKSIAINTEVPGELFTFPSNPTLTAGTIYHVVWTNTGGSPTSNYISSDGFFNDGTASPYYSLTAWGQLNENGSTWSTAFNTEPIMAVTFTNGHQQGMGYVDSQPTTQLTGSTQAGESFTVSGGNKVVNAIHVHMGMTGSPAASLTVTVKQGATTVFTGTIPSSSFSTSNQRWGVATISPNLTLANGTAYSLQLSCSGCSGGGSYFTDPMNKGTGNGYNVASTFPDGNYQVNGSSTGNQDAQFYFTTVSSGPAANVFLSQSGAGTADGSSCANARAATYFNSAGNWGTGTTQIGAGTTVQLCGNVTTALTFQAGGSSGNPVTLLFTSGASMTAAAWSTIAVNGGGFSNIVLDLGTNGVISNSANGTAGVFANSLASVGVDFSGSGSAIIRGESTSATIGPMYVRTGNSTTDNSAGAMGNRCINWSGGSNITISGITTHDCRFNLYQGGASDSNISITNTVGYNQAAHWWVAPGSSGSTLTNVVYTGNSFHDPAPAWDSSPSDFFHIDGFHYFCQPTSTCSGLDVHNNSFSGNFGVDYTAQIFTETTGGTNAAQSVYNNTVVNTTTSQSSNGAIDLQTGANGLVVNNTVLGSGSSHGGTGIQIISGTNITFKNNIVDGFKYMDAVQSGVTFASSGANTNSYFDWINGWQWMGADQGTITAWRTACSCDSGAVTSNPNLNAVTLVPNAGSPVISAGTNLHSLAIVPLDSDINGVARPVSAAWDIGALQGSSAGPPVASFSPSSLSFGNQTVSTTSSPQSVTLTNTGGTTLTISSIALQTGTQFAISSTTCGATLGATLTCTVSVTFTPTATGAKSDNIAFTDNAAGSPQLVPLSGTGTQGVASLSPSTLTFGNQVVSTSSSPQTVTLTNTGNATFSITSITLQTGTQYSLSGSTCGATLTATSSCTFQITFTPTTTGFKSDSVVFTGSVAQGGPVGESGTGVNAASGLGSSMRPGTGVSTGTALQ